MVSCFHVGDSFVEVRGGLNGLGWTFGPIVVRFTDTTRACIVTMYHGLGWTLLESSPIADYRVAGRGQLSVCVHVCVSACVCALCAKSIYNLL